MFAFTTGSESFRLLKFQNSENSGVYRVPAVCRTKYGTEGWQSTVEIIAASEAFSRSTANQRDSYVSRDVLRESRDL